jgi:hypothetical protein
MRKRIRLLAVIVSLIVLAALNSKAQGDPNAPDTVYLDSVQTPSSTGVVSVYFRNDEPLAGIEVTLKLDTDPSLIVLDSVSFVGSRVDYVGVKNVTNHPIDTAFTISVLPLSEPLVPIGNGLFCKLYFSFSGALDSTLVTIDSGIVINFDREWAVSFSDSNATLFYPQFRPGYLYINSSICCIGNRGNVDGDINDVVNILDLTYLINRLFRGGPLPPCPEEANLDGDQNNQITVLDLTFLVDRLFRGGPAPGPCP